MCLLNDIFVENWSRKCKVVRKEREGGTDKQNTLVPFKKNGASNDMRNSIANRL